MRTELLGIRQQFLLSLSHGLPQCTEVDPALLRLSQNAVGGLFLANVMLHILAQHGDLCFVKRRFGLFGLNVADQDLDRVVLDLSLVQFLLGFGHFAHGRIEYLFFELGMNL